MNAALYLHIPFCTKRCGYCDFYTVADRSTAIPAYLEAIKNELRLYSRDPCVSSLTFETIFFGGGTPSLLSAKQLGSLIELMTTLFNFAKSPEITVETNPGTVTLAKLRNFRQVGINRLSLGLQSFHESELAFLERNHSKKTGIESFHFARKAGFDNISVDLIYALPGQSIDAWQENLTCAVQLQPNHISAYNLTFETGTPLTNRLQRGDFKNPPEEAQRNMHLLTIDFLQDAGYFQYEISNYAKTDFESRHNQKYWDGSPYIGVGASAHSFLQNKRFWNIRNYSQYIQMLKNKQLPVEGGETLKQETLFFEKIYLGLRQKKGVYLHSFQKQFGISLLKRYAKPLKKFFDSSFENQSLINDLTDGRSSLSGKYLMIDRGFLKLTNDGIVVCDAILTEFV